MKLQNISLFYWQHGERDRKERLALKKNARKRKDSHLIPKENCHLLFNIMLHFNYIAYIKYIYIYIYIYTRRTQKE